MINQVLLIFGNVSSWVTTLAVHARWIILNLSVVPVRWPISFGDFAPYSRFVFINQRTLRKQTNERS